LLGIIFLADRSPRLLHGSHPGFTEIIKTTGSSTLLITFFFGLLWGIGGLTYGLGVRYLGVSLGSSIILGLCMVFRRIDPVYLL
jgi:L-rhamnose-H+ transport protein